MASGATWHDIYIRLGQLQDRSVVNLIKSYSGIVLYYLILSSLGNESEVSLTIQGITAALPTALLTAVASVGLFLIAMQLQSTLMIMVLRSHEGTRLSLRGFSMGAYGFYNDQDELELSVPLIRYGFFKEVLPTSAILSILMLIVVLSLLTPLFALWVYLLNLQFDISISTSVEPLFRVVAAFGIFSLLATALYLGLYNAPLPTQKDSMAIRWGFLIRLHSPKQHPRLKHWLEDSDTLE